MKSAVNKFDYPTAASHAYKFFTPTDANQNNGEALRHRYRQVYREERHNERAKVKMEQQRKKQMLRRQNKRKLQTEIENKKKELLELEKAKNIAMQAERQAHQLAKLKQQRDRIKVIQQQKKCQETETMTQNRFVTALRRMETEKQIANKKQKEAQFRRKTAEEMQKVQRNKAIKYRQAVQQEQRNVPERKISSFGSYKQSLGRVAYNHTVDYTKSYIHNPVIMIANTEQQGCAIKKGEQEDNRKKEASLKRKQLKEQHDRISKERGEIAIEKMRADKQYQQYRKEQQQKALQYNIERIQAGKRNQYIGVKPATLSQMEAQRKLRRQEEFQQMFFEGRAPEWFDRPAEQHKIQQARLANTYIPSRSLQLQKGNPRSNKATISQGHYSFESQGIDDLTAVKKEGPLQNAEQTKHNVQISMNPLQQYQQKRMQGNYSSKNREELNYSESEQDEYH